MDTSETKNLYHEEVAKGVWVMSNHKWAWYCWEYSSKHRPIRVIHIDYHWDSLNDFTDINDIDLLTSLDTLFKIESFTATEQQGLVKDDSFIAPAVIRGLINEIHFYCFQDEHPGFYQQFVEKYNLTQFVHSKIEDLLKIELVTPFILDIDLDFFNKTYFPTERDVHDFISKIQKLLTQAEIITIAKSDLYNWKLKDGEYFDWDQSVIESVSSIVIPKIITIRETQNGA
jgi:hypothetical protein